MKNNKLAILLRGIIKENPVLILILGTCPTIGATTSMFSALSLGLAATAVLICSNFVISLLRKVIPDTVRIPCYIVVISSFVTAVSMILNAWFEPVYGILGIWLPLITVNCIVLGRAEMFARKNNPLDSVLDGLGMGLGFIVALLLMATIREVFGAGTILSGMSGLGIETIKIPVLSDYTIPFLTESSGGFLVYGLLIALMAKLTEKRGGLKRKDFSCEGCPSASICNKTSCSEFTEISADVASNNNEEKEVAENA